MLNLNMEYLTAQSKHSKHSKTLLNLKYLKLKLYQFVKQCYHTYG